MIYSIDENTIKICNKFAEKVQSTCDNSFQDRYITSDKFKKVLADSKMCEYAVYKHLRNSDRKCTMPNINIYQASEKSFDADLFCYENNTHIHVKTMYEKNINIYGLSWLVSASDPIVINKPNNHWYALTVFKDPKNIRIVGWLNCSKAIYGDTKLPKNNKKAIYYQENKHSM